ncbi:MAG: hypothetical protein K9L02_04715 [Acholeplasmataceae bacterium]|nr:hypothetical protein [Acholeplasmataceae bacterium]
MKQVINGKTIEFIEDTHEYYVDGIKVPSVTQIVASVLPSQYKDIDPAVLQRAADKGISLHKEIELFETTGIVGNTEEFKNYLRLKRTNQFYATENEVLIYIEYEGKPVCAGRLDMIIQSEELQGLGIGDIKRTYNIHHEHLKLQLNLYAIGYEQSYLKEIKYLRCIHLRNGESNYIDIPIDFSYASNKLKEYHY